MFPIILLFLLAVLILQALIDLWPLLVTLIIVSVILWLRRSE